MKCHSERLLRHQQPRVTALTLFSTVPKRQGNKKTPLQWMFGTPDMSGLKTLLDLYSELEICLPHILWFSNSSCSIILNIISQVSGSGHNPSLLREYALNNFQQKIGARDSWERMAFELLYRNPQDTQTHLRLEQQSLNQAANQRLLFKLLYRLILSLLSFIYFKIGNSLVYQQLAFCWKQH